MIRIRKYTMEGHNNHMSPETQMNRNDTGGGAMMTMRTGGHMTFFWSKNAEILFSGWPGNRTGMYVLGLIFVFVMSVLVEWLSQTQYSKKKKKKDGSSSSAVVHGLKIGVAYLVMLAVMSFNVGVFMVAVAGHTVGFFIFSSNNKTTSSSSSANISSPNC